MATEENGDKATPEELLMGLLLMAIEALTPFEEIANRLDGNVPAGGSPLYAVIDECREAREALTVMRSAIQNQLGTADAIDYRSARDLGALTFMKAYIRIAGQRMGIPIADISDEQFSAMAETMIPALNGGAEVGFGVVVQDRAWAVKGLENLRKYVEGSLPEGNDPPAGSGKIS